MSFTNFLQTEYMIESLDSDPYDFEITKDESTSIVYEFTDERDHTYKLWCYKNTKFGKDVWVALLSEKGAAAKSYKRIVGKFKDAKRVIVTVLALLMDLKYAQRPALKGLVFEMPDKVFGSYDQFVTKVLTRELRTVYKVEDVEFTDDEHEKTGLKGIVMTVKGQQYKNIFKIGQVNSEDGLADQKTDVSPVAKVIELPKDAKKIKDLKVDVPAKAKISSLERLVQIGTQAARIFNIKPDDVDTEELEMRRSFDSISNQRIKDGRHVYIGLESHDFEDYSLYINVEALNPEYDKELISFFEKNGAKVTKLNKTIKVTIKNNSKKLDDIETGLANVLLPKQKPSTKTKDPTESSTSKVLSTGNEKADIIYSKIAQVQKALEEIGLPKGGVPDLETSLRDKEGFMITYGTTRAGAELEIYVDYKDRGEPRLVIASEDGTEKTGLILNKIKSNNNLALLSTQVAAVAISFESSRFKSFVEDIVKLLGKKDPVKVARTATKVVSPTLKKGNEKVANAVDENVKDTFLRMMTTAGFNTSNKLLTSPGIHSTPLVSSNAHDVFAQVNSTGSNEDKVYSFTFTSNDKKDLIKELYDFGRKFAGTDNVGLSADKARTTFRIKFGTTDNLNALKSIEDSFVNIFKSENEPETESGSKQAKASKLYKSLDLTDSNNKTEIINFLKKNIKIGTKKYELNSNAGVKYLNRVINELIELVPISVSKSYSIGGPISQVSTGGIKLAYNDMHHGGYYAGNTHIAFCMKVGGSYPAALKFAITEFMKSVFENLTSISETVGGYIFDSYGSSFSTIGVAYKGTSYYKTPLFAKITITSKYLTM